jgi:hypothetical protein
VAHFVQKIGPNSGASGSAINTTIPAGGIPVGDKVVAVVNCGANSPSSITDSRSNTYSLVSKNSAVRDAEIWAADVTTALLQNDVVSVTSAAGSFQIQEVIQLTGIVSGAADKTANNSNATPGTALATGTTAATTQADEIAVCVFAPAGGINATMATYVVDLDANDAGSNVHLTVGHLELSAAGTQAETATASGSTTYGAAIATFKGRLSDVWVPRRMPLGV